MTRPVFIVNPAARGGACGRRWRRIEPLIGDHFERHEVRWTTHRGHATQLGREALAGGAKLVISVGGDGTHSELAAAFFDGAQNRFPDAALGLLPIGTGGDLARGLQLDADPRAALCALAGEPRPFDVGHLTFRTPDGETAERIFINIASGGLSGEVVACADQMQRWLGGFLTFFAATLRSLAGYRASRLELAIDGQVVWRDTTLTFAVCNGRSFGGGMRVAPEARFDDGLFDVVLIAGGRWNGLRLTRAIYRGRHLDRDFVHTWRGREVEVQSLDERPVRLDVDGEQPGVLPARWRLLPASLRVLC